MSLHRDEMLHAASLHEAGFRDNTIPTNPRRHVAIITCMDARIDLFRILGLQLGDAHILRNAGGRVTDDTLRSLTLSANLLGTREFVVIHHTGCGLHGVTNQLIADSVADLTGVRPITDFLPFEDLESSVGTDVAQVAACPTLPSPSAVWGAVYDVHHGTLRPVGNVIELQPDGG